MRAKKNTEAIKKTDKLTERIKSLELILGFDENNKRNGNGLITLIDEISKRQTEGWQRIERLREDTDNLETKLNQINEQLNNLSFQIKNLSDKISDFDTKLKEHSGIMSDTITGNKIVKAVKGTLLIAALLGSLGTIFGIIAFIYNKLMH